MVALTNLSELSRMYMIGLKNATRSQCLRSSSFVMASHPLSVINEDSGDRVMDQNEGSARLSPAFNVGAV
jgi:hypothetical protein